METTSNASEDSEVVLETLRNRGWCFGDLQQVKAMITIHYALAIDAANVVDSVESEVLNLDLRSIGGKSLPDPSLLRKSSYLQGPKVLQISSVRDISRSTVDEFSRSSGDRRLLRLVLTDGHSDVTAIEYSHIPVIPDNFVPGAKIRLEDKTVIRSGMVCLNSQVLTILGGVVQPLYEEWQMNKKYSGFTRSALRKLEESDADRPPQFVKLHVGSSSGYGDSIFRTSKPISVPGKTGVGSAGSQRYPGQKSDSVDVNQKSGLLPKTDEEKPSSSGTRPKEVVESVPIQNQAAAQKLRQKMSQPNQEHHPRKGRRHRGKERQEDSTVWTLEEFENRQQLQAKHPMTQNIPDTNQDEILACQLQNQLNVQDSQVQRGYHHEANAEDIRMSMFNYERDDSSHHMGYGGGGGGGGRGRGRGRGKGRGRGRGGGRGRGW